MELLEVFLDSLLGYIYLITLFYLVNEFCFILRKKEKPDLITLDITMPDQSGVRTYRYYKGNDALKDTPVIIVTALGDSMKSFLKKLAGFPEPEGFMSKPIDEEKLLKMVSDLLNK